MVDYRRSRRIDSFFIDWLVLEKILTIAGPTASGKTDASIQLAERFNGEIIGELSDMMSLPANDVYVINRGKKEILIPVVPEIVRGVDAKMGVITISPMDGLID